ncbi:MAG TPA: DUF1028 domain-containing protein, partial [Chloroflexota bacterium]|nr:DUF1028 domain-containing protein [Chloroflexota bacterium]
MRVATFSIVAADPEAGDCGVAVASKFLAVGAVVPFARADVGAVATQALANTTYGSRALDLMAGGRQPVAVGRELIAADPEAAQRQFGLVDASGNAATFTGDSCNVWAGGRSGQGYAAQGNILLGPQVVEAMESAFLDTQGSLADRLLAAIGAGDAAG